ncbi:MAG: thioredoxin family protein [bacterium]
MWRNVLYVPAILIMLGCASTSTNQKDTVTGESDNLSASSIHWHSLSEGRKLAMDQGKPMVVDFFVPQGCPRCARMIKEVYSDARVIEAMNRDFIPIRIDLGGELTKEERQLGEAHDYRSDCLLLFLDSGGDVIEQPGGKKLCFADYVSPELFVEYLNYIRKNQ